MRIMNTLGDLAHIFFKNLHAYAIAVAQSNLFGGDIFVSYIYS